MLRRASLTAELLIYSSFSVVGQPPDGTIDRSQAGGGHGGATGGHGNVRLICLFLYTGGVNGLPGKSRRGAVQKILDDAPWGDLAVFLLALPVRLACQQRGEALLELAETRVLSCFAEQIAERLHDVGADLRQVFFAQLRAQVTHLLGRGVSCLRDA